MKKIKMELIPTPSFLKLKENQVDRVDQVDHFASNSREKQQIPINKDIN